MSLRWFLGFRLDYWAEQAPEPSGQCETRAHHVSVSPQEDRGGTAGKVG